MVPISRVMAKNCTRVTCASVYNFLRNGVFFTYIPQPSIDACYTLYTRIGNSVLGMGPVCLALFQFSAKHPYIDCY